MIARNFIGLPCLILLLSLCASSVGQEVDSDLPSVELPLAEDVIEKHILARGGYECLAGMSSTHSVWSRTEGPTEWKFERWRVPGQKYSERSSNGQIDQTYGCWVSESSKEKGTLIGVAWRKRGDNHVTIQRGAELQESLLGTATIDESVHWFDRCKSVQCVAKKKIDGKDCYQLKFIGHDGEESDRFFDVESSQLVRRVGVEHQTGGSVVTRNYSNHQQVGYVVVAMKQTIISSSGTHVWELQSFEHDEEIDFELFGMPEQVRIAINELSDHATNLEFKLAREAAALKDGRR